MMEEGEGTPTHIGGSDISLLLAAAELDLSLATLDDVWGSVSPAKPCHAPAAAAAARGRVSPPLPMVALHLPAPPCQTGGSRASFAPRHTTGRKCAGREMGLDWR
jgi:hypothetical protein